MLGLALLAVYGPTVGYAFVWDDRSLILDNPFIAQPLDLGRVFRSDFWLLSSVPRPSGMYRPLVFLSYWVEWRAWGGNPAGFHAVNVVLHGLVVAGVVQLGRKLGLATLAALAAGAIVGLHPVAVEAVSNVASRPDLMATTLVLAGTLLWLRTDAARWGAVPVLFAATLCKETALFAPLFAVLAAGRPRWREGLALVPAVLVPWAALRGWALGGAPELGAESGSAGGMRILHYLGRIGVPVFRAPNGDLPEPSTIAALGSLLLVVLLVAVGLTRLRGAARLGLAWAGLAVLPVSELVPIGARAADLLAYTPLVGLALVVAAVVRPALLGLLAIVLAAVSATRVPVWQDSAHLWAATLEQRPDDALAQLNLGRALADGGDLAGAEALYRAAIAGDGPVDYRVRAASNLGNLLRLRGDLAGALAAFEMAIGLSNRLFPQALFNSALVLAQLGRQEDAIARAGEVTETWPETGDHWRLLGALYAQAGRWEPAIAALETAVARNPGDAEAARMLRLAKERAGATPQPSP